MRLEPTRFFIPPPARSRSFRSPIAGVLGILLLAGCMSMQPEAASDGTAAITVSGDGTSQLEQSIQGDIDRWRQDNAVDPAIRERVVETLGKAREELTAEGAFETKIAQTDAAYKAIPAELAAIKAELSQTEADDDANMAALAAESLESLQQKLATATSDLAAARVELKSREEEPSRLAEWRTGYAPKAKETAQAAFDDCETQLRALASAPLADPGSIERRVADAERVHLRARAGRLEKELAWLERQRIYIESNGELLVAREERAARVVERLEKRTRELQKLVDQRRLADAERQATRARATAEFARPEFKKLAEENALLASAREGADGLPAQIDRVNREKAELDKRLLAIKDDFRRTQDKIRGAGDSSVVGLILQQRRAGLPNLAEHRRRVDLRKEQMSQIQLNRIELDDRWDGLRAIDERVEETLRTMASPTSIEDGEYARAELRRLLEDKANYLSAQIADSTVYFNKLIDLDLAERQLIAETERYAEFIGERVMWVRSDPALDAEDFQQAAAGLKALLAPTSWTALTKDLVADVKARPAIWLAAVVLFGPWLAALARLRRRVTSIGKESAQSYAARMSPTAWTVAISVLVAGAGPALMWFLGWRLESPSDMGVFSKSIGHALSRTAGVFLVCELFRAVCRKHGLAEAHFGWSTRGQRVARRGLRLVTWSALPLKFVACWSDGTDGFVAHETFHCSLGRSAFILGLLVWGAFAWRTLHPNRGAIADWLAQRPGGWLDRLRHAWFPFCVALPLIPAALAAMGYYYSAQEIASRLKASLWLGLGLLVAREFLTRWVLVARRKLAVTQARERRAAEPLPGKEPDGRGASDARLDLAAVNRQAGRMLHSAAVLALSVGLWFTWVDVLPALKYLDQWVLWRGGIDSVARSAIAPGASTPGTSGEIKASSSIPADADITAADLLVAAVVMGMTIVAGRNLPGLLEIWLLQRLPLDPGGRYALSTVARYAITLVGGIWALRGVGIGWANVQWLAAAITVGLGFGLQEIFANFISGLIILFERPIRVGDTVTVGGVSGTVSRIRIRATTIVDADRKELIVPNREFITGQVVNWTLTDAINRLVIPLGVAYGSNTALVSRTLLNVARRHPLVLENPAPAAVFLNFGASALEFEVRVFAASLEHFSSLRHELNTMINDACRDAGIEIAFPQCEVTVKSGTISLPLAA